MAHRAAWRQEQDDLAQQEHQQQAAQPMTRGAKCYACGRPASRWIRSTSAHFSAPRCDGCGERLIALFAARGVNDVTVDLIGGGVQ